MNFKETSRIPNKKKTQQNEDEPLVFDKNPDVINNVKNGK